MAITAQYGEPEYTLQNATDLSVAVPYTLLDAGGATVGSGMAVATVNKDNPTAQEVISTGIATQVRTAIADAEALQAARTSVGTGLLTAVAGKVEA